MLRRGRELRGPLSAADAPSRTSRHSAFEELAHAATSRVAARAGLREADWELLVLVVPPPDVGRADRWGRVRAVGGRWQVVLHRLAFGTDARGPQDQELFVQAVVADLLGEALGRDPEELDPDR